MLDNLPTEEQKTRDNTNLVLQNDTVNSMDETRKQQGRLKKHGSRRNTSFQKQVKTDAITRIHNEGRAFGKN